MTYCNICELDLPTEAKYKDHCSLLHEEELSIPAVIAVDKKNIKKTLEQLGVTVSDSFPEDPVAGQIHYTSDFTMYVYDGTKWRSIVSDETKYTGPVGPIGVAGTTGVGTTIYTTSTGTGSYGTTTTVSGSYGTTSTASTSLIEY